MDKYYNTIKNFASSAMEFVSNPENHNTTNERDLWNIFGIQMFTYAVHDYCRDRHIVAKNEYITADLNNQVEIADQLIDRFIYCQLSYTMRNRIKELERKGISERWADYDDIAIFAADLIVDIFSYNEDLTNLIYSYLYSDACLALKEYILQIDPKIKYFMYFAYTHSCFHVNHARKYHLGPVWMSENDIYLNR